MRIRSLSAPGSGEISLGERAGNVALCSAGSGPLHREKDSEGHDDLADAEAAGAVATAGVSEGIIGLLEVRSLEAGEAREVTAPPGRRSQGGLGEDNSVFAVAVLRVRLSLSLGDCMLALRPGENSRIHDVVTRLSSTNSSGASSHACVSCLDAMLAAPARAHAASSVACRTARTSAAVGLCMHDDGTLVHDACSNSWSDTVRQGPTGTGRVKGGWPLACAEVHQLLPGQFVFGHG